MKDISDRIKERRIDLKLTQAQIGKAVGVSRVSVTKWESGLSKPDGENLQTLARVLQCTPDWLLYGGEITPPTSTVPTKRIPLLSWDQVENWSDNFIQNNLKIFNDWVDVTLDVSPSAFALTVKGESMTNPIGLPTIPERSIVIVDNDFKTIDELNGKIILANPTEYFATIKKLVIDGPNYYLMPLNPLFRPIETTKETLQIIGRVISVIQSL